MGEITGVDAPQVSAIGDAVLDVAGRLERLAHGTGEGAWRARSAVAGSQLSEFGAADTALSWQEALQGLAEQVRAFGTDLRQAAADYQESDAAAAGRLNGSVGY